ncbi:MAG TPA: site-2 protease family protein [Solirubrobacteraceae bacterium]|nr:site-2 protease family protein [Solirubrobacteraceae bacterium]
MREDMEYGTPPTPTLPEPSLTPSYPPTGLERPDDDPNVAPGRKRPSFYRRRIAPIGAAILAFLTKIKAIILLLPKAKLLVTAGSMAVSIAAYASIWGFSFAIGFVILLLVHEMGHVIALRREGIKASAPMFIPFLGALISARSLGDDALAEARVGLAGPILGSIGSALCLVIWQVTGHDYWRALAYTGLFLNLFNLLPVVPLDGGRAMAAMSPWMWFLGLGGIVALAFAFPNPIIILIAILAAYETYRRWEHRRAGGLEQQTYYRVSPRARLLVGVVYLGLVALLVIGMDATHLPRVLG